MIILYGTVHDEMIELMCSRLNSLSYKYLLIDPFGELKISFTYGYNGSSISGKISYGGGETNVEEISGIYTRLAFMKNKIKGLSVRGSEAIKSERNSVFVNFIDQFPGLVINRVGISSGNDSKLYQQHLISASGFLTPRTIITRLPSELKEFYHSCNGKVIYKSISGIRSVVKKLSTSDLKKFSSLKNCPVQFQELIEGIDIRVHTVGKKTFATAVESDSVDYRYGRLTKFYEFDLPPHIIRSCLNLSRSMGFVVAGIDLKKTPEGKYYCFEVNPSPAFIAYERMTGQPVSLEVAKLLNTGKY